MLSAVLHVDICRKKKRFWIDHIYTIIYCGTVRTKKMYSGMYRRTLKSY